MLGACRLAWTIPQALDALVAWSMLTRAEAMEFQHLLQQRERTPAHRLPPLTARAEEIAAMVHLVQLAPESPRIH